MLIESIVISSSQGGSLNNNQVSSAFLAMTSASCLRGEGLPKIYESRTDRIPLESYYKVPLGVTLRVEGFWKG